MKKTFLFLSVFIAVIISAYAAMHIDVDWPPSEKDSDSNNIILDSKIKKDNGNMTLFDLSFKEKSETKKTLWALSIFTFGQLEIKDGENIIARIEIQGRNIYGDQADFTFSIQDKYIKDSVFILRTYPVESNLQKAFLINKWNKYGDDNVMEDVETRIKTSTKAHLSPPNHGLNYIIKLNSLTKDSKKSN